MPSKFKEFLEKNNPKGRISKLEKHRLEIVDLRDAGFSYEQIKDYLVKFKRVKVDKTTICKYYKKLEREAKVIPSPTLDYGSKKEAEQVPVQKLEIKQIENTQKESNQNSNIPNKNKVVQLKRKIDPKQNYLSPPKTISDEEFLTLCDDDQIIYCYKLFHAGYEEEGDRLLRLPGVDSVSRSIYRAKKRKMYERCYFKKRKDLDIDN